MTTTSDDEIKASIDRKIKAEAGQPPTFATVHTSSHGILRFAHAPLLLTVYENGIVSEASRPEGPDSIGKPLLQREDLSPEEFTTLETRWSEALARAVILINRGTDVAIVAYANPARIELRQGPDFKAPAV